MLSLLLNRDHSLSMKIAIFLTLAGIFSFVEAAGQRATDWSAAPRWTAASGLAILAVFVLGLSRGDSPASSWSGALLMAVGIVLRGLAIRSLGARFVAGVQSAPRNHLVTRGIYSALRHPSEAGLLSIGAGAALLLGSSAALLVFVCALLPSVLVRVREEELQLRLLYKDDYLRYSGRVPALLPFRHLSRWRAPWS